MCRPAVDAPRDLREQLAREVFDQNRAFGVCLTFGGMDRTCNLLETWLVIEEPRSRRAECEIDRFDYKALGSMGTEVDIMSCCS